MAQLKTILVPTDFSSPADSAVRYAAELARVFNTDLVLYHSFTAFESSFYPEEARNAENQQTENSLLARLQRVQQAVQQQHPQLQVRTVVERGPGNKKLLAYCAQHQPDLMVMGTTGASGLKEAIIGSFTADTMTQAPCPVLAIPDNFAFGSIKKITYASDYKPGDAHVIRFLENWKQAFGATLCVLHITPAAEASAADHDAFDRYQATLKSQCEHIPQQFEHLASADVPKAILQHIATDGTDLLAIMPLKHEGVWDTLFHRSVTKNTAYHIRKPLLTVPSRG